VQLGALLVGGLAATVSNAERVYVIEQLLVNVKSAPDDSGERIATVKSGDRLEALGRVDDEVHVRLANGRVGWIRARYVSRNEPLRTRLVQREADVAQLKDQVSHLQAQLHAARSLPTPAATTSSSTGGSASTSSASTGSASVRPPSVAADAGGPAAGALFSGGPDKRIRQMWPWALGPALAGLGIGFALGALVLDRHIRRKYGGLRIH